MHKINPALMYTPKEAGGVGLASAKLRVERSESNTICYRWLKKDIYYAAWKE